MFGHVGDRKAKYLEKYVRQASSRYNDLPIGERCVELGSYCGYSALCIGQLLSLRGKLISIEKESQCVMWTKRLIEYAGLSSKVIVLHGTVESLLMDPILLETLQLNQGLQKQPQFSTLVPFLTETCLSKKSKRIHEHQNGHSSSSFISPKIDLLFIDHDKSFYKSDLQLLIQHNFFTSGSIVVADNILSFNQPMHAYMDFVKDPLGPFELSVTVQDVVEYSLHPCNVSPENVTPENVLSSLAVEAATLPPSETFLLDALEISIFK